MQTFRYLSILLTCILSVFWSVNSIASNVKNPPIMWSIWMAESEMQRHPHAYLIDWRTAARWDYTHGLELMAFAKLYQKTGDTRYFNYIKEYVDSLVMDDGTIKTYQQSKYNIDMLNAGKLLFFMYDETGNKKYRLAIDTLVKQLEKHPRTTEGGFWHKKRYTSQMWLDGLYMGAPFYAEYIRRYGQKEQFSDVIKQFQLIEKHLYRPDTQLPVHGWDESKSQKWADPITGQSANHWSRSIGWYAMAMVDVLAQLPDDYPEKTWLSRRFKHLIDRLLHYQNDTGTWYQVTDKGDEAGNYPESSGSSMFTYAIIKGVLDNALPAYYLVYAEQSYAGLIDEFIAVDKKTKRISITSACEVAGLGGKPYRDGSYDYYLSENIRDNDPKAVGPFILASLLLGR